MAMEYGTVVNFDSGRGWGFICPDHGDGDIFVHQSGIDAEGFRTLMRGQRVEFERGDRPGDSRVVAKNVRPLEAAHGKGRHQAGGE